jgi:hypothetical protein
MGRDKSNNLLKFSRESVLSPSSGKGKRVPGSSPLKMGSTKSRERGFSKGGLLSLSF